MERFPVIIFVLLSILQSCQTKNPSGTGSDAELPFHRVAPTPLLGSDGKARDNWPALKDQFTVLESWARLYRIH